MVLNMIRQFKWVDILVVILLVRICYIAFLNGLVVEFFKLLGTIFGMYISLHYFTELSDFFRGYRVTERVPLQFLDFLCMICLIIIGYLIFVLLRNIFSRFIKIEAVPKLNRLGGLLVGGVRGFLCVSLVAFILAVSYVSYLKTSVESSYYGNRLFKVTTATYSWLWHNVSSKFMRGEKFNSTIPELQRSLVEK